LADVMTQSQRSRCMSRIRGRDTGPELLVRNGLWRRGLRYRLRYALPGHPDIVFPKERIAVFIDGCFWHRCPVHFREPATNTSTWEAKISGNVKRDRAVDARLMTEGWEVLRFWEHQVDESVASVIARIARRVAAARRRLTRQSVPGSR
jgi:DNA mismatch endonuclease, patch repair protein